MKRILSGILATTMLTSLMPVSGLAADNMSATQTADEAEVYEAAPVQEYVEIQVQDKNGTVLATNNGTSDTLVYNGTYNYEEDVIVFLAPQDEKYMMVQVDDYVGIPTISGEEVAGAVTEVQARANLTYTYGESLVYAADGKMEFTVPYPSDYNDANNFSPYDSRAFAGTTHTIKARVATEEEIYSYRNLAVNPFDNYSTNVDSTGAVKQNDQDYDNYSFPHAITNYVTRDELRFVPRNAIDGFCLNNWHSFFPYQSWAGGARDDLEFSVLFGRTVEIDKVNIYMRGQWSDGHDSSWASATLEFSDGTSMDIELEKTHDVQTFVLPEKKQVSWVQITNLTQPTDNLGFAAITEFEVYGNDIKEDEQSTSLPSSQTLLNQAEKVDDYWINLNGGSYGTYEWNNAVYYTGNMELYYLTGDENYLKYSNSWAEYLDWIGYPDYTSSGTWGGNFADNHVAYQTFLDLYNIAPDAEKIAIAKKVIDTQLADTNDTWWWWIDAFYMAMPVYTKLGVLTGDNAYFDKMYAMFEDAKTRVGLYDTEDHLWYRDAKYLPGESQGTSSNGKKVYWSRGNGWVMAALSKVLQDLPDSDSHREEYETIFKEMAASLLECQGDDGLWRRNLGDYEELSQPETSGSAMFLYAYAWGVNNGLLDADTYMPAIVKGYHGLNAVAIHPDGRVGRVQPIGENPSPTQDIGYAQTQDFGVGAVLLMLCELSKMDEGIITDDVQPMLEKRLVNSIAVKTDSTYAVVGNTYGGNGCEIKNLVDGTELTAISSGDKVYIPVDFVTKQFRITPAKDIITENGTSYVSVDEVADRLGKEVFVYNDIVVIANQKDLFDVEKEEKLLTLLDTALTDGAFTERPEYENKFDHILPPTPDNMVPVALTGASATPEAANVAKNTLDRSLGTRWSAEATTDAGQWIRYSFDNTKIDTIGVAFYKGKQRATTYQIEVSADGKNWVTVCDKKESSTDSNSLEYTTFPAMEVTDVRITGYGNSVDKWVSISEVEILAAEGETVTKPDTDKMYFSTADWSTLDLGEGHTGKQIMEFDTMPLSGTTDAVIAYTGSDKTLADWADPQIAIRMNTSGFFDARNGSSYTSLAKVSYVPFETYHVKITVDVEAKTYDVEVTDEDGQTTQIAKDFAFRSGTSTITDIGKLCVRGGANVAAGNFVVMNHTIYAASQGGGEIENPDEENKPEDNNKPEENSKPDENNKPNENETTGTIENTETVENNKTTETVVETGDITETEKQTGNDASNHVAAGNVGTGDSQNIVFYMIAMLASMTAGVTAFAYKRKRK